MSDRTHTVERALALAPPDLWIGGQWRASGDGRRFDVEDPGTGETIAAVADATAEDGVAALTASSAAQRGWAATSPQERADLLLDVRDRLLAAEEDLGALITLEMGKPLADARGEVRYAAAFFRWFAEEAVRIEGRWSTAPAGSHHRLVLRQPIGPVLAITPWNFPIAMGARKLAPALAAGCTAVLKPAPQTPLTTLALARVLAESGLPDGVVNVIPTSRASVVVGSIIGDRRLRKLTFTGSTAVGRALLKQAGDNVLRTSMELGGNAPFIVCEDADLEAAVEGAMQAKMRNMGEACTAANRLYVHERLHEPFVAALTDRMASLRVGHGLDPASEVGPLIDADAVAKVRALVDDAGDRGGSSTTGGHALDEGGHFFAPTVLTRVPADARASFEEIFGPVAVVHPFQSDEEAISLANDTEYGLVAYVFTEGLSRALRYAEQLETGMVGLNRGVVSDPTAPFGGVKHSGLGREGGPEGLDEFLETKMVALST